MSWNTTKTIFGFFGTLIRGVLPNGMSASKLESIYNYRRISDRIHTSGQPSAEQFALIKAAGFDRVINLAPHNAENALADENGVLSQLAIEYVHIPVSFKGPTETDFDQFVSAMQDNADQKTWVHCAANMRVSAFLYRYRRDVLGDDEAQARRDLNAIWDPFGVWKDFVAPQ